LLLPPSEAPEFKTSQLVAYFRCPFSFAYVVASYGCCSCCSCHTKVEKKEVAATQEHKKPTSKKNIVYVNGGRVIVAMNI
jgi:hypothetical protein